MGSDSLRGGSVSGSVKASTGVGLVWIETGSGVGSLKVSGSGFGVISGSGSVTGVVSGSGSGMGSFSDRGAGSAEETSLIAWGSGVGSYFAGSAVKTCKN